MPVTLSQRPLTPEEKSLFRNFRERPSAPLWALRVFCFFVLAGTCCGGLGQVIFHEMLTTIAKRAGVIIAGVLGTLYFVWVTREELRSRRRRRQARLAAAESGVVEITEVEFDRMWTVTNHPDKRSHVVLECYPHLLVMIPVPADEDEHERIVKGLFSRQEPAYPVNGTFPRRRVVIECVRIPDQKVTLQDPEVNLGLSISWLGDRMEPSGEIDGLHTLCDFDADWNPSGLWALRHRVPRLVRGPWMNPPGQTP